MGLGVMKSRQRPVDVSPFLQSISWYPAGLSLSREGDAERREGPGALHGCPLQEVQ